MEKHLDQDNETYYYCTKHKRLKKIELLNLILSYFQISNTREVDIKDIQEFLKQKLNVKQINNKALATLICTDGNIVTLDNFITTYNRYSDEKISENKLINIPEKKINKNTEEYFYCSKSIKFPLKRVVEEIRNLFIERNVAELEIYQIYVFLLKKFNVKQFNKQNLYQLLKSSKIVSFNVVNEIFFKLNSRYEIYSIYNFDILKKLFILNRNKMIQIINSLGVDFLNYMLTYGLNNATAFNQAFCDITNNESTFILKDVSQDKILNKDNSRLLIEFLSMFDDEEWVSYLNDQSQIDNIVTMYIEDKKEEEEKLSFYKFILGLAANIHGDNCKARIKFLFPYIFANIFLSNNIKIVGDLINLNKKTALALYSQKDALILLMNKLSISLICK